MRRNSRLPWMGPRHSHSQCLGVKWSPWSYECTGASLPTLEAPYQGFWDQSPPLLSHISIMKYFSFAPERFPSCSFGKREAAAQACACESPWWVLRSLRLFRGSPSFGTPRLMLWSKRTPTPGAASQIYWNFMSCPDNSFVRRPNLRWPLRLIAYLRKNADVVGTEGGFFFPLPPCPSHSVPCHAFANAFRL